MKFRVDDVCVVFTRECMNDYRSCFLHAGALRT